VQRTAVTVESISATRLRRGKKSGRPSASNPIVKRLEPLVRADRCPRSRGNDALQTERLEPFYDGLKRSVLRSSCHPTTRVPICSRRSACPALEPRRCDRSQRCRDAPDLLGRHGTPSEFEGRHVAYRRRVAYQAGRMDKNGKKAICRKLPSTYLKRMYTDTVSPQRSHGVRVVSRPDHVMYGSDYPCWMPADALRFFNEVGLPEDVQQKILSGNARASAARPRACNRLRKH